MDITSSKEGRARIVKLKGDFDIASSTSFDERVNAFMDQGDKCILLDFSEVSFIASTGLRMLLKMAQRSKDEGGKLHICCINDVVRDVFSMTGFDTILLIFDTKELALKDLE